MFMNNGKQTGGDQDLVPCFGTINWDDFKDIWQFPQTTDIKTPINTSKDIEGLDLLQCDPDDLSSIPIYNQGTEIHSQISVPYSHHSNSSMHNGGGVVQSTAFSDQVSSVHPPTAFSYTQGFNSSMSNDNGVPRSSTLTNQIPNVPSPTSVSYEQCSNSSLVDNNYTLPSVAITNQVSNEDSPSTVPNAQSSSSSTDNEDWAQILAAVQDPKADISPFRKYVNKDVNQGDGGQDTIYWTQQDTENLLNFISEDQIGTSNVTNNQTVHHAVVDSPAQSQSLLSGQKIMEETDFQKQNTHNKLPENHSLCGFISQDVFCKSGNVSNLNTTNLEKCDGNVQIPLVNYSVSIKACEPYFNDSGASQTTYHHNAASTFSAPLDHVSGQNIKDIKRSIPRPMRTRVGLLGRCRENEVPLYLQPEPENAKDKKIWRRAIISHKYRVNRNNELTNNANIIEKITKEMDELRNNLRVVTAERDTLKATLDTLKNTMNTSIYNSP